MAFTKDQPKDGDTILHCGHRNHIKHWFKFADGPIKFARPDGSRGEAEWFTACDRCFIKHGNKAVNHVKGDSIWTGNAPAIEEVVEN